MASPWNPRARAPALPQAVHILYGSAITLHSTETDATVTIHNTCPHISAELIEQIFDHGVSDQAESGANGNRGQGLFS
nr:hypothetical protein [uncultured Rhodoferax sp.]